MVITDKSVMDNFNHHLYLAICHLEVPGSEVFNKSDLLLAGSCKSTGLCSQIHNNEQTFERTRFSLIVNSKNSWVGLLPRRV